MPSRACLRPRSARALHLLALLVLALGLLGKPLLVAACEIGDMRLVQGSGDVAMQALDAAAHGAQDDCCPGQSCGACCTAVTAVPGAASPPWLLQVAARPLAARDYGAEPAPREKTIRPPIAG